MSGGMILPAEFAEKLRNAAAESEYLHYKETMEMEGNVIPEIFEVRDVMAMSNNAYHVEPGVVVDGLPDERRPGGPLKVAEMGERRRILHLRRYHEVSYILPDEAIEEALTGAGRGMAGLEAHVRAFAGLYARDRYLAEQTHAANVFNNGGLTAGDPVFDNSHETLADQGGDLMFDGVEFLNASGNTRTALSGSTYYTMAGALNLTDTNVETAVELGENTNAYDELGNRIPNTFNVALMPVSLRSEGERIFESEKRSGTGNNDLNTWKRLRPIVWPFLTDADAWFVGKARAGLVWWQGGAPDIKIYEVDRVTRISFQSKFGCQANEWRNWVGCNVAAS